jgi:hypothetical protein
MNPINRALSALDAYCARNGVRADHEVIVCIREGIAARQGEAGCWQALLDEAMDEAGCAINWDGDTIRDVTVWGEPPRRPHSPAARNGYSIPFGNLDAQKAEEDGE